MAEPIDQPKPTRCRSCGAPIASDQAQCWLCNQVLSAQNITGADANADGASDDVLPTVTPAVRSSRTFGLDSLMLVMTLVAVCLGMVAVAPGLGILLAIVSVPALVRTIVASDRDKQTGNRMGPGTKVAVFAASVGLVIVAGVSAAVAFYATCWAACGAIAAFTGENVAALYFGIFVGGAVGLMVLVLILRRFWATRSNNRDNHK